MNFPEYLKERISEDYKNLIIQKLQEIKEQTENLKNSIAPSVLEINHSLRNAIDRELRRIHDAIEAESNSLQKKITDDLENVMSDYLTSWYHSDISPFQQQLEIMISDIVSNLPARKKESGDVISLVDLMNKIDDANTQSEILNVLLQHIADWVDRAVLFIVRGNEAFGWAALGLGADWDAGRVRQIKVDLTKPNLLGEVVHSGRASFGPADMYSDNGQLFLQIGAFPRTALAFPVLVRGKIAGILYADLQDDLSEKPDIPNLLFLSCRAAGFAVDLLPLKSKKAPVGSSLQAHPVASEMAKESVAVTHEEAPTVMMPAPQPISEEDQKLHEDAKRFARLLISEIKLYNEAQVSAGRENKDLYERLKDDIERSRKMYMDRVPSHIYSTTNYFYEELVRTLANGDSTVLGM